MASLAKLGKGTKLYLGGDTSPETYNAIPEIISISGSPGGSPDLVDITNHDSVGLYREQLTGLITQPEMACQANYINDQYQNDLEGLLASGEVKYFKLEIPAVGGTLTAIFQGRVRNWVINPQIAAQQLLDFTIQPSGAPIWTGMA